MGQAHTAEGQVVSSGVVAKSLDKSIDAVVPELGGDAGLDGPGGGEIAFGAAFVTLLPLRQSPAVKCVGNLRVALQRRREIVDRQVEFAELR